MRHLWSRPTLEEFKSELNSFITRWSIRYPPYVAYFTKTWCTRYPSALWAFYTRNGNNVPSGDQLLESWHNQFKSISIQRLKSSIDQLADDLWNEWEYQYKKIAVPEARKRRQLDYNKQQQKQQKRRTLVNYMASSVQMNTNSSSENLLPFISSQRLLEQVNILIKNC